MDETTAAQHESPKTFTAVLDISNIRSTPNNITNTSRGNPNVLSINTIATKLAEGTPATPTEVINAKKIELKYIDLDKSNPKKYIKSDLDYSKKYEKVFLIDDVLNTGKTLMYSVNKLLEYDFNSIKTVVLIDRNHKKFPVKVDFKGISLSTNFDDTVKLDFKKNKLEAIII